MPGRALGGGSWRGAGGGGTAGRAGAGRTRRQWGAADRAAAPRWHVLGAKQGKVAAWTESAMGSGGRLRSWGSNGKIWAARWHCFWVQRVHSQTRAWETLEGAQHYTCPASSQRYVPSCRHEVAV